jgi:hypothetical protein
MMLKKLFVFPLALLLSLATLGRVTYAQPQSKDAAHTSKVKAEIARRGKGRKDRVTIRLRDGQELKGRIEQTNENTFTLADEKTGQSTILAFSQVKSVRGRGLNKGKKIGIIAALAVGVVVLVGVLSFKNFHPFENGVLR